MNAQTFAPAIAIALGLSILTARAFRTRKTLAEKYRRDVDSWALITGASSGIGKAYAELLAAEGFNVILCARRKPLLDALAIQLADAHCVVAKTLELNVGDDLQDESSVLAFRSSLIDLMGSSTSLSVVIHFAGNSDLAVHSMLDKSIRRNLSMCRLNVLGTLAVSQAVMPLLLKSARVHAKRSAYVTPGAITAYAPTSVFTTSSANKHYVRALSECMHHEYAEYVDVMVAHPVAVESEIVTNPPVRIVKSTVSSKEFASSSLEVLRRDDVPFETVGSYWVHRLADAVLKRLPSKFVHDVFSKRISKLSSYLDRPVDVRSLTEKIDALDLDA